ncbi:MAG: chromosomal replication initiator protein DnaA, partial [Phycisphaerales bacterium]|nr:chromosomal replication initiator protein DnaA [Phycisphaerales bacterium]
MPHPDHVIWADILSYLRKNHPGMCRAWFEEIEPVGTAGGVLELRARNEIQQRYLDKECSEQFNEAAQHATGRLILVRFLKPGDEATTLTPPTPQPIMTRVRRAHPDGDHESLVFSPDYSFENFVVGPENRLAHAAAVAVSDNPGRVYNPLFVHGGVGLGKTHLLQAICLKILTERPGTLIHYVSCDAFMTQFIDAVQAGQLNDFRHRFRDVDLLVIDDIHFLAKRDRTQEEFFHNFNSLYQSNRQIVLSSDAAPHEIPDLEARLVSRFQSGLVVEVLPPCYETRVHIVKQKARIRGLTFPDDVACHIAANISSNIREIEGAITKVQMQHLTDNVPINLDLARAALGDPSQAIRPEITITTIIDSVIEYYGVKLIDLQSKRRQKSIAHPRQVCMYLARRHTRYSLEEIGGYFGGRDHTT